ncbi:hypothetical protein LX36DRAFT_685921 [Colletotrichum falcatum]|nr:hypothetical protein LX36DRAFT_685921 [Colletotrichum falcatum]
MAQTRMPSPAELAEMVSRHYHRFPSETLRLTREALENPEPYHLFQHIENLISIRRIDDILRKNAEFRGLLADMYGQRYEWLRDADLGVARWQDSRESATAALAARAKESEREPTAVNKTKRDLMIEKLVEGGEDINRWARVLGFEGVEFPPAEIQAAATRMKKANTGFVAEDCAWYGAGEVREDIGGVDPTTCPDGPEGTYGPSSHIGMVKQLAAMSKEHKQPPPVPRAPAEGGKAPRNPFTTEWRARDAPDGWEFPATFDPYYNSNQYIRRSTRYRLPGIRQMVDDDEVDDDDDDGEDSSDEHAGSNARSHSDLYRNS